MLTELQSDYMKMISHSVQRAKTTGCVKNGDLVVITGGIPVGLTSNTNTMRIEIVGE